MRRLFWQMSVTLDGFMEGPNRELDDTAQVADEDFDRYASAMLQSIDGVLLGRKPCQLFAGYWPSASGPDADRLNQLPKIVCSRILVTPVVLGRGTPMFKDVKDRVPLELPRATPWRPGVVALYYQPAQGT